MCKPTALSPVPRTRVSTSIVSIHLVGLPKIHYIRKRDAAVTLPFASDSAEQKCQCSALTAIMRAAAGLLKALPAPGCSGIDWPFKVARNCLAGISGLELWFRENNSHTILEALKVLVANLHPCLVYCCTSGIRQELKITATGCLFRNAPRQQWKQDYYYGYHEIQQY